MNVENRKPIVIAVACGIIAVLMLVLGVSFSGVNDDAAAGWQSGLSNAAPGGRLTVSDLDVSGGGCSAAGTQLKVVGSCVFEVRTFGGLFEFGAPTKRARLAPQQPVIVTMLVEKNRTTQEVQAGKTVDLTFGTSGGQLGITCPVGNCVLQLLEAGG